MDTPSGLGGGEEEENPFYDSYFFLPCGPQHPPPSSLFFSPVLFSVAFRSAGHFRRGTKQEFATVEFHRSTYVCVHRGVFPSTSSFSCSLYCQPTRVIGFLHHQSITVVGERIVAARDSVFISKYWDNCSYMPPICVFYADHCLQ